MELFFQILAANVVLLFVLITVHEIGHWSMGLLAGIPIGKMRIRLLTFPQQVVLRDESEWVSVADYDRYHGILSAMVPSRTGRYLYVVGGFLFETIFLVGGAWILSYLGYKLYAIVAVGVSLTMYLVYVFAMDLPQANAKKKPWGDTTILYAMAPKTTLLVSGLMIVIRIVLVLLLWLGGGALLGR